MTADGTVATSYARTLCYLYVRRHHSQSRFDAGRAHIPKLKLVSETSMFDILYLAIGLGTFGLLAFFARSLGRI